MKSGYHITMFEKDGGRNDASQMIAKPGLTVILQRR